MTIASWRRAAAGVLVLAVGFAARAAPIVVQVQVMEGVESEEVDARLVLTPLPFVTGEQDERAEPVVRDVALPSELALDLDPRRPWRLQLEANGWWSAPTVVLPAATQGKTTLRAWPAAQVFGRVAAPDRVPLPGTMEITLSLPGVDGQPVEDVTADCPIVEKVFRCTVPSAAIDLRLHVRGFVPHYVWEARPRPMSPQDLGTLALRRGGSVAGWVAASEGELESDRTVVSLAPAQGATPPTLGDLGRQPSLARTGSISDRGFFQIQDLAPGSYVLSVSHPAFAPKRLFPVTVLADAETMVREPLILERPVDLEVTLSPQESPQGEAWRVELLTESDILGSLETAGTRVAEHGLARFDGLAPGRYRLSIADAAGRSWAWEELVLEPSSPPYHVDLPIVQLEGDVTLGEEPLQARLYFGGFRGTLRIPLRSDEEGHYQGLLPEPGPWIVGVEADDPPVVRQLRNVEVPESEGSGPVTVDLRLPGTLLHGHVEDARGQRIEGAVVQVLEQSTAGFAFARSDGEGRFRFHGLEAGPVDVEAFVRRPGNTSRSPSLLVHVPEKGETPDVVLVVEEETELSGRVVHEGRGLPGVPVIAVPSRPGRGLASMAVSQAATGVDGMFRLAIPADSPAVLVHVLPPGFTLGSHWIRAPFDRPVELSTSPWGSDLAIEFRSRVDWSDVLGPRLYLVREGMPIDSGTLEHWLRIKGVRQLGEDRVDISGLSPGTYVACLLPPSEALALLVTGEVPTGCQTVQLPLGGTAEVTLEAAGERPSEPGAAENQDAAAHVWHPGQ